MVLKTTRWSPDSCSCVLDYEWDDSLPNDQIVISYKAAVRQCANHVHLTGNNKRDTYDSVVEENRRKNGTIAELLDRAAADFGEPDPQTGAITLKRGITVTWTWSGVAPNRIMTLTVTGITLTPQKLTAAQNFLNNRFGVGRVVLINV